MGLVLELLRLTGTSPDDEVAWASVMPLHSVLLPPMPTPLFSYKLRRHLDAIAGFAT